MIISYDNHKEYAFLWIDDRCGEIAVSHIDGDALFTDG